MKNFLGVFYSILISLLLMTGCNSQAQPRITPTITFKPTIISSPIAMATFLSTPTLAQPLPTKTPLPLPEGIFNPFQDSIFDATTVQSNDDIVKTAFGVIQQNSLIEEKVLVDSTMSYVVFSLFGKEDDLELTLVQPDGKEITPSMAKQVQDFDFYAATIYHDPAYYLSYISNPSYKKYYVFVPKIGAWIMKISGKSLFVSESNYMIQATTMDAMGFHYVINPNDPSSANDAVEYKFVPLQRSEHFSGDPIVFTFGITDSTAMLAKRPYIHGVSMIIILEDPAKKQYSLELYDDGIHEDGTANDGVYGNVFTNTSIVGTYNIYLQISGKNNRAKEPFTREYIFSIVVK